MQTLVKVQIPIHHVGDAVADHAPPNLVRDFHQRQQVVPFDGGQRQPLFEAEIVAGERLLQWVRHLWARRLEGPAPRESLAIQHSAGFNMFHTPSRA